MEGFPRFRAVRLDRPDRLYWFEGLEELETWLISVNQADANVKIHEVGGLGNIVVPGSEWSTPVAALEWAKARVR